MRTLLVMGMALLLAAGCGGSKGASQVSQITTIGQPQQTIYVTNESDFPDKDVTDYVRGQNLQLQRDFKPVWAIDAALVQSPPPDEAALQLIFCKDFTRFPKDHHNIHGVHYLNKAHVNYLVCGPEGSTKSAASHEVLEMLANRFNSPTGYECCDPVAPYAYDIDGQSQNVADFVFPSYFQGGSSGPWDYMGLITRQGRPAPGGFNWNPTI